MTVNITTVITINIKMAVAREKSAGFECEFVEEPPKYLQTECPVCLLILREPYQVTCCGKSYCKECIGLVTEGKGPCPCCKQESYHVYSNKGLQQPLYEFKVRCSNKKAGCQWTGQLGDLDNHLNLTGKNERDGCAFTKIKCTYCSSIFSRKDLRSHKNEHCKKRPHGCIYCNSYNATFDDVVIHQLRKCGHYPVKRPNKCGASPKRKDVKTHVATDCPLTVIECDFSYAGCVAKLPRKSMSQHVSEGLTKHFSLLALSHKKQQDMLKEQQDMLKEQQDLLTQQQEEVKTLKQKCTNLTVENGMYQKDITALYEHITKLRQHLKLEANDTLPISCIVDTTQRNIWWTSTHFYSNENGCKMCISVRNTGTFTYIISVYLMKGEFDHQIRWPIKANVNLYVKDVADKNGEVTINIANGVRVMEDDKKVECGYTYITLQRLYVNSLHLKILSVQML